MGNFLSLGICYTSEQMPAQNDSIRCYRLRVTLLQVKCVKLHQTLTRNPFHFRSTAAQAFFLLSYSDSLPWSMRPMVVYWEAKSARAAGVSCTKYGTWGQKWKATVTRSKSDCKEEMRDNWPRNYLEIAAARILGPLVPKICCCAALHYNIGKGLRMWVSVKCICSWDP